VRRLGSSWRDVISLVLLPLVSVERDGIHLHLRFGRFVHVADVLFVYASTHGSIARRRRGRPC
jgi:hypothetical protein